MIIHRHIHYTIMICLLGVLPFSGCVTGKPPLIPPPLLSIQQRAAMQTKELDGNFDTAFSATISVLQDEGWQIEVVEKSSGIIQASSLKRQDMIGPQEDWYAANDLNYRDNMKKEFKDKEYALPEWTRWEQLTSHIEKWGNNRIRQRITITKYGSLPPNTFSYSVKEDQPKIVTTGGKEQSILLDDPTIYQYLFQRIQRAIFIRQGLHGYLKPDHSKEAEGNES